MARRLNMWHWLEAHRDKLNSWLRSKTTLDFSDWAVFTLWILGVLLFCVLFYLREINLSDLVQVSVLWITFTAVLQNTKETYWLNRTETRNLKFQKAPFVIVHYEDPSGHNSQTPTFILKNVGRGPARNVRTEIPGSGLTFPVKTVVVAGEGGFTRMPSREFAQYKPTSERHYQVIVRYENLDGAPYKTELNSGNTVDDFEVASYYEE